MSVRRRPVIALSPRARREYTVELPSLSGGLNLQELSYRLRANESPAMKNLYWQDGVLSARDGQIWAEGETSYPVYHASQSGPEAPPSGNPAILRRDALPHGEGYAAAQTLFYGSAFYHAGDELCCMDVEAESGMRRRVLYSGLPEVRGTFFRYRDRLFYKTRGAYISVRCRENDPDLPSDFIPEGEAQFVGDGSSDTFSLPPDGGYETEISAVTVDGEGTPFTTSRAGTSTSVCFDAPPVLGACIAVLFTRPAFIAEAVVPYVPTVLMNTDPVSGAGDLYQPENRLSAKKTVLFNGDGETLRYRLPFAATEISVKADGADAAATLTTEDGISYAVFASAPAAGQNNVAVTCTAENADAEKSIMDCRYACVYGANDSGLCIIMAGAEKQPNAYFWNGNTDLAMDAGYFPMEFYNFAGDTADPIRGFGLQQDDLMVLNERSVGRAQQSVSILGENNRRLVITMDYTPINSRIGCDLPWSIQLIENNLVFCNTSGGVYMILSTSAAYENNIQLLSRKIGGTAQRGGLLSLLQSGVSPDEVCSLDDGSRYYIAAKGEVYLWDYAISGITDPSWFYFTDIFARAFIRSENGLWHMDGQGRISKMLRCFCDYDAAIEKSCQFATQHFGSYDRLKDVRTVLLSVRSDTETEIRIRYACDYGEWEDPTPIRSYSHRLAPRDLRTRDLSVKSFAAVFRRRPALHHLRHFTMTLCNANAWQDMSVVSAQIFYRYQDRER